MLALPVAGMVLSVLFIHWTTVGRLLAIIWILLAYGLGHFYIQVVEPTVGYLVDEGGILVMRLQTGCKRLKAAKIWKSVKSEQWWATSTWERREILLAFWIIMVVLLLFARDNRHNVPHLLWWIFSVGIPFSLGYVSAVLLKHKKI